MARYIVAKAIYDELSKYTDIKNPELPEDIKENLAFYREELKKEKK